MIIITIRNFQNPIEGFHVTSQQLNRASHAIHSRHVGSFFALSGIRKSHKICSHSLLLNLHNAKLHRSNNVINIFSFTAGLTCSNKISKKLKYSLLSFSGFFLYRATQKKNPTWRQHEVRTGCIPRRETLYWFFVDNLCVPLLPIFWGIVSLYHPQNFSPCFIK